MPNITDSGSFGTIGGVVIAERGAGGWSNLNAGLGMRQDITFGIRGVGAISANAPTGAIGGGNARGTGSVDLQSSRTAVTQVASALSSTISGGSNNTANGATSTVGGGTTNSAGSTSATVAGGQSNSASGTNSTVCGGTTNTASGVNSVVSGGSTNTASGTNSWVPGGAQATTRVLSGAGAYSCGQRTALGDAQVIRQVGRRTTSATSAVTLTTDGAAEGAATVMVLPNASGGMFSAMVTAFEPTSGDAGGWKIEGTIKRGANAAATSLQGTTTITAFGIGAAIGAPTVDVIADTTLGAVVIRVTPANTTTTYWVGEMKLIQVA